MQSYWLLRLWSKFLAHTASRQQKMRPQLLTDMFLEGTPRTLLPKRHLPLSCTYQKCKGGSLTRWSALQLVGMSLASTEYRWLRRVLLGQMNRCQECTLYKLWRSSAPQLRGTCLLHTGRIRWKRWHQTQKSNFQRHTVYSHLLLSCLWRSETYLQRTASKPKVCLPQQALSSKSQQSTGGSRLRLPVPALAGTCLSHMPHTPSTKSPRL